MKSQKEDNKSKDNLPKIEFEYLEKNELRYDKEKTYKYIKKDDLNKDLQTKLIDILIKFNSMPNNYLRFVYETYLEYLKDILSNNVISNEILQEYKDNKFGLIIKVEEGNEKNQQLIFYCTKKQDLLKQFFLAKNLNGPNEEFNLDKIEIKSKSKSRNESESSNKSVKEYRDNKICNYISENFLKMK